MVSLSRQFKDRVAIKEDRNSANRTEHNDYERVESGSLVIIERHF